LSQERKLDDANMPSSPLRWARNVRVAADIVGENQFDGV
jgi:hypothetical protein